MGVYIQMLSTLKKIATTTSILLIFNWIEVKRFADSTNKWTKPLWLLDWKSKTGHPKANEDHQKRVTEYGNIFLMKLKIVIAMLVLSNTWLFFDRKRLYQLALTIPVSVLQLWVYYFAPIMIPA